VHPAGAVPVSPRATAPSDRLVVSKARYVFLPIDVATKAKCQVVAVSLAGCTRLKRFQDYIGDSLRCEDVAPNDGRFVGGREEGVWRDEDLDGL
jgi:hypothetical protein